MPITFDPPKIASANSGVSNVRYGKKGIFLLVTCSLACNLRHYGNPRLNLSDIVQSTGLEGKVRDRLLSRSHNIYKER